MLKAVVDERVGKSFRMKVRESKGDESDHVKSSEKRKRKGSRRESNIRGKLRRRGESEEAGEGISE
jgi:hypothetical protein